MIRKNRIFGLAILACMLFWFGVVYAITHNDTGTPKPDITRYQYVVHQYVASRDYYTRKVQVFNGAWKFFDETGELRVLTGELSMCYNPKFVRPPKAVDKPASE